ncbi:MULTISPECIES: hypothetical protein [unclassified Pseudomonas]|uniref:hypothetical protein n=1 Tax=unclassified Pseudomonas TaxID=196821 RepID=UPI0035C1B092
MKITILLVSVVFVVVFFFLTPKSVSKDGAVKRFLIGFSVPVVAILFYSPAVAFFVGLISGLLRVFNYNAWSFEFRGLLISVFILVGALVSLVGDVL